MSQPLIGRIMNYRKGIKTQMSKECLVQISDVVTTAQAGPFFGRKVVWKNANKKVAGRIVGLHGKNGVVRVKFNKGMPGQAIGTTIEIVN